MREQSDEPTADSDCQRWLESIRQLVEAGEPLDDLLSDVADGLRQLTQLDHVLVILGKGDDDAPSVQYASLSSSERRQISDYLGAGLTGMRLSKNTLSVLGNADESKPVVCVESVPAIAELLQKLADQERIGNLAANTVRNQSIEHACLGLLRPNGTVVGAIIAFCRARRTPTEDDVGLMRVVTELIDQAIGAG